MSGYSKVYAPRFGVVSALMVRDGDAVAAGHRVAVVKVETPNASGIVGTREQLGSLDSQSAIASQQVKLAILRSNAEATRLAGVIKGLARQIAAVQDQIAYQSEIVASMRTSLDNVAPAAIKGFISRNDYERRRQTLLSAQLDLSRLRQQATAYQADIIKARDERNQAILGGENDQATARSAFEAIHQQRIRVEGEESYSILAPVSGRVTSIQTGLGRAVEPSVPLMAIVPETSRMQVDLFVPSRAIGFVKKGQEVRLLYDAFPYQRFGSFVAHVDAISRVAVTAQEVSAPFDIKESVYRVSVRIEEQEIKAYGGRIPLQPGMTLTANLILERQSFADWILDPIRAVSNRD